MTEHTIGDLPPREEFLKSTFSQGEDPRCLHAAARSGTIYLWESETPFEPQNIIQVPHASFAAFLQGAKAGQFDHMIQ